MRRLAALLAGLLFPLLALPANAAAPVLVIYPFSAAANVTPPSIGKDLPNQIGAEVAAAGGITVIHSNAAPENFLSAARTANADAYLTGAIVRVGNTYSAIEQLVSSRSGVLLFSLSFQFSSLAGATSGGSSQIHDLLLNPQGFANTGGGLVASARSTPAPRASKAPTPVPAKPTPTPVPVRTAAPAPTDTPLATTAKDAFAVMPMGGPANSQERAYATDVMLTQLRSLGLNAVAIVQSVDPTTGGADLCATTGATTLIASTLTTKLMTSASPQQIAASVGLQGYRCQTHQLDPDLGSSDFAARDEADAIRQAMTNAVMLAPSVHVPTLSTPSPAPAKRRR